MDAEDYHKGAHLKKVAEYQATDGDLAVLGKAFAVFLASPPKEDLDSAQKKTAWDDINACFQEIIAARIRNIEALLESHTTKTGALSG